MDYQKTKKLVVQIVIRIHAMMTRTWRQRDECRSSLHNYVEWVYYRPYRCLPWEGTYLEVKAMCGKRVDEERHIVVQTSCRISHLLVYTGLFTRSSHSIMLLQAKHFHTLRITKEVGFVKMCAQDVF